MPPCCVHKLILCNWDHWPTILQTRSIRFLICFIFVVLFFWWVLTYIFSVLWYGYKVSHIMTQSILRQLLNTELTNFSELTNWAPNLVCDWRWRCDFFSCSQSLTGRMRLPSVCCLLLIQQTDFCDSPAAWEWAESKHTHSLFMARHFAWCIVLMKFPLVTEWVMALLIK